MGADYVAVTMTEPPHLAPGCMVNRFVIQGMAYRKIADAPSPTRIDATVSDGDPPSGLADDVRQLDELRRKGVLTDEEFERAKAKLLAE